MICRRAGCAALYIIAAFRRHFLLLGHCCAVDAAILRRGERCGIAAGKAAPFRRLPPLMPLDCFADFFH